MQETVTYHFDLDGAIALARLGEHIAATLTKIAQFDGF
jgi:hypothetical protein